jgi:hypothetical protein
MGVSWSGRQVGAVVSDYSYWLASVQKRLQFEHITPLLLSLLGVLAYVILRYLLSGATHFTRWFLALITCNLGMGKGDDAFGNLNCIDVSYQRAVDRGLIKGLASYNILQNPKYKKAFAISDRFAMMHTHVESIRGTLGNFDDDESDGGSENDRTPAATPPPAMMSNPMGSPRAPSPRGANYV